MSDGLEVRFSTSRKRRGLYDVEYIGIVIGLIRDGTGAKSLAYRLGVSKGTTEEWLLSYRVGGGATLIGEREGNRKYDCETKLVAVLDHLERGMSRPKVMERYDIASRTCLKQWCQDYHRGGPEALRPKPKGRPKGAESKPKPAPTREQLLEEENTYLEARVVYLEKARALLVLKPTTGRSR